jgi:uncharacterized protein
MLISLVRLPNDGLKFEHRYDEGELNLADRDFILSRPVVVAGRVDRVGAEMRLRGHLETLLRRPCDRCLTDVEWPIDLPFDLIYVAADKQNQRTGEVELNAADLGISVYENDQIDLDEMVVEQLELSLPFRLLCSEDCRGLCPQCGADLNTEECDCQPLIDPRWEALAAVKENLEKK